ncbi:MAG TPA: FtsX-like permease family protein [Nitrospiraceae bacterium]|nr:FtsX-like permease family protein [Nitrospiraceae bacterium]
MTSFAINMAWRETRAAWRHFLYFFICIALGVGALVGVGVFAANVERTVTREARALMGGDVEIRLSRRMSESGKSVLEGLAARKVDVTHVSELVAMASRAEREPDLHRNPSFNPTQIIELKAVEGGYPFYGVVRTTPKQPLHDLLAPIAEVCQGSLTPAPLTSDLSPKGRGSSAEGTCYGAVVQESLLIKMGLAVGDPLKIGQTVFTITGVIRQEPDRAATAFSLGPRVMISQTGLAAAELIKPGSRIRERYLLRLPPDIAVQPLIGELGGKLAGDSARVSSYREAQPQLRRFLEQLTRYLGLIGLTALFVGGIGVASTVHAFLKEKLKTIAILKTVGAGSGTIVRTYLFQALCLGFLGSLVGAALGLSLQGLMPRLLAGFVPPDLLEFTATRSAFSVLPFVKGLALGVATTLLFAVWPLLSIRDIRPALVFRTRVTPVPAESSGRPWWRDWRLLLADRVRLFTAASIAVGMATSAIWQAGSVNIGLVFIGALTAAVIILYLAAALLMTALKRAPSPRSLAVRHAMGNLYRPGSQAVSVMVSVGIGVMIIVTISLLEQALVNQIGESRPVDAPTFFFIDIQPDQRQAFQQLIQDRVGLRPEMTPLVRSRLHAVNGQPVTQNDEERSEREQERDKEGRGKSWYFTREYVLTFLDRLPKDNALTKGEWWFHGETLPHPLVSIEEEAAKNLGLDLGSMVEFDIQGTTLAAEVSSIRKVEWNNFSTNFYMILSPGALEGAPFTYVATVRVAHENEVPLQQAVVAAFPNVTAINIREVMESFSRILEHLSFAIRAVALFCMLAGAIVMAAALATSRYRRLYESVVFKALGATRNLIAGSFAVEYVLMGAVAGIIGVLLASALSWAVLHFFFDLTWTAQPGVLAVAFVLTVALTLLVGFLTTFRILGERPLAILRHE